jgi:transcriptional regulator with XRE-family HTH domain
MSFNLPSNVREHRKRWALSQPELAYLLRLVSPSSIASHETLANSPGPRVLLRYEALFGTSVSELFPALLQNAEDEVAARAKLLIKQLERAPRLSDARKLELLAECIRRTEGKAI